MKALKISLVVFVVAAICVGIFFGNQSIPPPDNEGNAENQFTRKIENSIKQLKAKPDSKFCKDFYIKVASDINDFYKPSPPRDPYGRFGKTQSENDQWKENLENNLYAAYADKFIKQAKTVFRGSEWKPDDLKFIQAEKNELKKSKLLVAGSTVDKELTTFQTALNKYNEIVSFISSCKGFGYSGTALSDRFPVADVQSKILRATTLRKNHLENEFVNHCTRLHDGLKEIPQVLFKKHVWYLDNKINNWSGLYSNYNSQKDYSNNLYKPLKAEIDLLNYDIYQVSNFDSEYDRLLQKWSADNIKAYNFKYQ
jgi:hypothetical protein